MEMLSKYSVFLDLKSYTCVDCNQEKPKEHFFNPSNYGSAHQKKSYKCNDCRDSYTKRYYDTNLKAKGLRTRSLKTLRTVLAKIKASEMSSIDYITTLFREGCVHLTSEDAEMFIRLSQVMGDILQKKGKGGVKASDYENGNDNANG